MPIKNYTTSNTALQSVAKIQESLIAHGASGIQMMYDDDRKIASLGFALPFESKDIFFKLPCEWRRFKQVLIEQEVDIFKPLLVPKKPRKETPSDTQRRIAREQARVITQDEFAYKVAWANLRDWVLAQMALYETKIVTMPQIFLPFVTDKNGVTLFEKVSKGGFLLGDGK